MTDWTRQTNEAIRRGDDRVDTARRAEVLLSLATERLSLAPAESVDLSRRAVEVSRTSRSELLVARSLAMLVGAMRADGSPPLDVLPFALEAVELFRVCDDQHGLGVAIMHLADLYFMSCVLDEASSLAREAMAIGVATHDPMLAATAKMRLAAALAFASPDGLGRAYRGLFEECAADFLKLGDVTRAVMSLYNLANSYSLAGEFEDCLAVLDRMEPMLSGGEVPSQSQAFVRVPALLAGVLARLGNVESAMAAVRRAQHFGNLRGLDDEGQILIGLAHGKVLAAAGAGTDAESVLGRVVTHSESIGDRDLAALGYEELTRVRSLTGRFEAALDAHRCFHRTYVELRSQESEMRIRALEVANRLDQQRAEFDQLRASNDGLEEIVREARAEIDRATRRLQLESSHRTLAEQRLAGRVDRDAVTGLPGSDEAMLRIDQMVRGGGQVVVAVLSVDHDRLVAPRPDQRRSLMQESAARLVSWEVESSNGFAAALGGDELAVIFLDTGDVTTTLTELHARLAEPVSAADVTGRVPVRVGASIGPLHGSDGRVLMDRAMMSLQTRSSSARGCVAVFDSSLEDEVALRTFIHENFLQSMADGELVVHYQPVISVASGQTIGAEALVRWTSVERGSISPATFVPILESTGQVTQLGDFVLRHACAEAASWVGLVPGDAPIVTVNVSPLQLEGGVAYRQIKEALRISGLPPARLAIELTETLLASIDHAAVTLAEIRELGVRVEIDDFGVGYSSFSYLSNFPADILKIDKSFVDRIHLSDDDRAIVDAIISMAHALQLGVVAEGVENDEQLQVLRALGCDSFQGWLRSRALPANEFRQWVVDQWAIEAQAAVAVGRGNGTS